MHDEDVDRLPAARPPERVPQHLFADAATLAARAAKEAKKTDEDRAKEAERERRSRRRSHRVHREFLLGLGRVQRVLANVPTYMMIDDHDVTDDFFLNPMWRAPGARDRARPDDPDQRDARLRAVPGLGQRPAPVRPGHHARASRAGGSSRATCSTGGPAVPGVAARPGRGRRSTAVGPDVRPQPATTRRCPDGRFGAVDAADHLALHRRRPQAPRGRPRQPDAAQLRRREIGPPGNVSTEALVDQIPRPPLPAGREVLVVIAPLQVIGPPVIDEVVARAIYRIFDLVDGRRPDATRRRVAGDRAGCPAPTPTPSRPGPSTPVTFEHLLARLAEHQRVVRAVRRRAQRGVERHELLARRRSRARPGSRSSPPAGSRTSCPSTCGRSTAARCSCRSSLRARLGVERLGWTRPDADLVLLPDAAATEADLVATTRARLLSQPGAARDARLAGRQRGRRRAGPRAHVPAQPGDAPGLALAGDAAARRPARRRAARRRSGSLPLDDDQIEAQLADPATAFAGDAGGRAAGTRRALDRMRNTRQMMFRSNFGICRFESGTTAR